MCRRQWGFLGVRIRNFGVRRLRLRVIRLRVDFLRNLSSVMGYWVQKLDHLYLREIHCLFVSITNRRTQFVDRISQHHYSGSFCSGNEGLLQDLMTKATIRSNLTSFSPDVKVVRASGLDYVLGETNSYSCHVSVSVFVRIGVFLIF
jgi:hypothetical protein